MPALNRNQIIASAAGTLEMLEILSRGDGPVTLGELVTESGRPKGTVHRMVSTLVNTGFATYTRDTGLYGLTLKAWRIGSAALRDFDLVERARPILDQLRAQTGETVHLSVLESPGEIVYVAKVGSQKSIGVLTRLGQLQPVVVHCHGSRDPGFRHRCSRPRAYAASRAAHAKDRHRPEGDPTNPRRCPP